MATQFVVLLAQAFDADAYADVGETLGKINHFFLEPSGGRDDDALSMTIALLDNVGEVLSYEWFAARQVDELELR